MSQQEIKDSITDQIKENQKRIKAIAQKEEQTDEDIQEASRLAGEQAQLIEQRYRQSSVSGYIVDFVNGVTESANTPPISTGFHSLDEELGGGLYEGLYTIGAVTSLGKTTLVLQICDQIAQQGKDVIIFSLEMARTELMAKSISRHTLQYVKDNNLFTSNAKTARGITDGARYTKYSDTEKDIISKAIVEYSTYTDHIYIYEGIGNIGVSEIRKAVELHKGNTGRVPVVVIDYLQILAPPDYRMTDKQATDRNIVEMKRLSRDYKTPVIGISSYNRDNYKKGSDSKGAVTLEAFKESGALEYTSDVAIGLQFCGAGDKNFDLTEAKKEDPRKIELVILKNRNGKSWGKVPFTYYPLFNAFEEGRKGWKEDTIPTV